MKQLKNYSTEELEAMKEKMKQAGVSFSEAVVLKLLDEVEETVEEVGFSQEYDGTVIYLDSKEYLILTDEEADELARKKVRELIEETGELSGFEQNLLAYMDKEVLREMMVEQLGWWASGLTEEELKEEMEHYGVENEEELVEEKADCIDPLDYWLDFCHEEELAKTLLDHDGFDIDEMIEDIINWYGREHELASYDGYEIELSTDDETFYAYRIN